MAKIGRYKIPRPLQDEDKYFKYFNKKQSIYMVFGILISVGGFAITVPFKLTLIGFIIMALVIPLAFFIPRLKMPGDKYLWGGGTDLEEIFKRVLVKRFDRRRRCIYIKE